ncbi:glycosyltransferase [Photobacterium damselae]|uniref:glycosyltransferase n=1 Tax=Photobacterium damselae TaxID=38293 RepID=UPI003D7E2B94
MILYISSVDSRIKAGFYNAVKYRVLGLKELGYNVCAVNFNRSRDNISWCDVNISLSKFFNSKSIFKYFTELRLFYSILRLILIKKPSVIHVHWAYPVGYISVKLAKLFNIKVIMTVHGSDIHTHPIKNKNIYKKTKYALSNAHVVFFVSESLISEANNIFSLHGRNFRVSYNFYNDDILGLKYEVENNPNIIKVSYVGNFNKVKGVDRIYPIIESLIRKSDISVSLTLAGDGPLKLKVGNQLKSLNVDIITYGHLSSDSVYKLIKASDVIIMPSYKEGFGLIALESFLLEKPCIAFNIDGLNAVYKFNKDLQVSSIEEFSDKIIQCKKNSPIDVSSWKYKKRYSMKKIIKEEAYYYE